MQKVSLARIMHRFLSRSDEGADLGALRHARREAPAGVLESTPRKPNERNEVKVDAVVAAVENLCIVRAKPGGLPRHSLVIQ